MAIRKALNVHPGNMWNVRRWMRRKSCNEVIQKKGSCYLVKETLVIDLRSKMFQASENRRICFYEMNANEKFFLFNLTTSLKKMSFPHKISISREYVFRKKHQGSLFPLSPPPFILPKYEKFKDHWTNLTVLPESCSSNEKIFQIEGHLYGKSVTFISRLCRSALSIALKAIQKLKKKERFRWLQMDYYHFLITRCCSRSFLTAEYVPPNELCTSIILDHDQHNIAISKSCK